MSPHVAGRDQTDEVGDDESLRIMRILDEARRQLGVVYPQEECLSRKFEGLWRAASPLSKLAAAAAVAGFVGAVVALSGRRLLK